MGASPPLILVCTSVALGACSSGDAFLDSTGLQAVILVALDGDRTTVDAYALDDDATAVRREAPAAGALYALGYRATLADLGLTPGRLEADARGQLLPAPDRAHQLTPGDGWTSNDVLPPAVTKLRVRGTARCAPFDVATGTFPIAADETPLVLEPLDADYALMATTTGVFRVIARDGSARLAGLSTTTPHLSSYRAPDGEIWLAARGGGLVRGTLERGFVRAPTIPLDSWYVHITGAAEGAPPELFACDDNLAVAHFDGTTWRVVRPPSGRPSRRSRPRIAWIEPGLAVMIGVGTSSITEIRADGTQRDVWLEVPDRPADKDAPYGVVRVAGAGMLVGSRYDQLYLRDASGTWTRLPPSLDTPRAEIMLDLGDRSALSGGQEGILVHWRHGQDYCDPLVIGSGHTPWAATRIDDDFMMLTGESGEGLVTVSVGRLRR